MAIQASNIIATVSMSIPAGRIIIRIMVLHMSAQFIHVAMQAAVLGRPCEAHISAQVVQACSQAEHASIHSCIMAMSMPGIAVSRIFIISTDVFIVPP